MKYAVVVLAWLVSQSAVSEDLLRTVKDLSSGKYTIQLISERKNDWGRYLDFKYSDQSFGDKPATIPSDFILILRNNENQQEVQLAAPNLNESFVSEDGRFVVLYDQLKSFETAIWVFDQGRLVFNGLKDHSKSDISMSTPVKLDEAETNQEEKVFIKLSCGFPGWIDSVEKILVDENNNSYGFIYTRGDEAKIFEFSEFSRLESYTRQQSEYYLNDSSYPFCANNLQLKTRIWGIEYSRWCADLAGRKQGPFEKWTLNKNLESHSAISEDTLLASKRFLKVLDGQYKDDTRIGIWTSNNYHNESSGYCEFKDGHLNGYCQEADKEYRIEIPMLNGFVDGTYEFWENNLLTESCRYIHGEKNGRCIEYSESKITRDCLFRGVEGKGECTEYTNDGFIDNICEYKGYLLHGRCTFFDRNLSIKSTQQYELDEYIDEDESSY
ncbi:hypothetical protein [Pleionea litopenaei]|uniref:Uncharacterized protein n=1 Tax=Pleionea litopenaei TaxID=3070815 RepID=A0AA51X6G0_9GAMM|nr:hypothetical protein [Pleionea sp. HL-JVS1]WMS86814.1 hypothetical protein Q9312_16460 [Pleionea sp. HL-JVS1]